RLDYLEADPANNARYAVKVLLKFLLLERRRIALAEVAPLLESIPLAMAADRNFLHMGSAALAHWVIAQLQRAGAAAIDGALLVNRD
ncbi:MAG: MBL fold metallo-hydrolase, partial [Janthinobacterium lividum]